MHGHGGKTPRAYFEFHIGVKWSVNANCEHLEQQVIRSRMYVSPIVTERDT